MTTNTNDSSSSSPSKSDKIKLCISAILLLCAGYTFSQTPSASIQQTAASPRRRLTEVTTANLFYKESLLQELKDREALFENTPENEHKYWFEYAGKLQKYYYRWSRSRGKADSFEGRDDSGVTSARFNEVGGGEDFTKFMAQAAQALEMGDVADQAVSSRLRDNCLALGAAAEGKSWSFMRGGGGATSVQDAESMCKVLFLLNTVGAGKGTTILWETEPPKVAMEGPKPWQSEQETASMHLERQLREINHMCSTGIVAARVQVLVCEPIPAIWTNWMDSLLVDCGGTPPNSRGDVSSNARDDDRYSPVQVVVSSSPETADTCHDLKSGFMERRMQELMLAVPSFDVADVSTLKSYPKTSHPDLVSSDDFDIYVALKWSSMITIRSINGFAQASVDLAAAAASDVQPDSSNKNVAEVAHLSSSMPSSPFLIPSFVRVSYVSEENSKVAKWRMHGDFFHPAAWEVCRDSFDMTFIPHSLSSRGGITPACEGKGADCGQWWIYMAEEQMPTSPEVFANEHTPPLVRGGSNYVYMLTERHRREIVDSIICQQQPDKTCGDEPQAVIPLGDMESFMVNFMPNTALGKMHQAGRRPGYSRAHNLEENREAIRERKKLKGQEDIEKALFDYTVYPVALFRKDATLKAARSRDDTLSTGKTREEDNVGPLTCKSSYYDVSIIKPRGPLLGWCQSLARRGLCSLYADFLRESDDETRCHEACGLVKDWTKIE